MNGASAVATVCLPVMVGKQGSAKRHFRKVAEKKWICKRCPEKSPFLSCDKAASMAKHLIRGHAPDLSPLDRCHIAKPYEGRIWMPAATLKRLRDEAEAGGSRAGAAGTGTQFVGAVEDAAEDEPDQKRPRPVEPRTFGLGDMRAHLPPRRTPTPAEKKEMDRRVLRFVVQNNVPFRATHSDSCRDMVSMFCDYTPPHRQTLAGSHLTQGRRRGA